MKYKHNIPIHLEVADHIVFGLTARQLVLIGAGLATGYVIWSDLSFLNNTNWGMVLNGIVSLLPALLGVAAAFIQPARRGLEQWSLVAAVYLALPKRYLWTLLAEEDMAREDERHQQMIEHQDEEEDD